MIADLRGSSSIPYGAPMGMIGRSGAARLTG